MSGDSSTRKAVRPTATEKLALIRKPVSYTHLDVYKRQGQLSVKDKQIEELNARLAEVSSALVVAQQTAQAAQALHGIISIISSSCRFGITRLRSPGVALSVGLRNV